MGGWRTQVALDYPRDGTGALLLAGKAGCEWTLLACLLRRKSWSVPGGVVLPSKTEQYPTALLRYRSDHPCRLKLTAKGYCSVLLLLLSLLWSLGRCACGGG